MSEACRELSTPVIGGNVSLYNESMGTAVYPTPVVGMVGLIEDLDHITTQSFKEAGDHIYVIGETHEEFGGSELQKLTEGKIFGKAPAIDLKTELRRQMQLLEAIQKGLVASAHDIAEGGFAVALAESTFGTKGLGVDVSFQVTTTLLTYSVKHNPDSSFQLNRKTRISSRSLFQMRMQ